VGPDGRTAALRALALAAGLAAATACAGADPRASAGPAVDCDDPAAARAAVAVERAPRLILVQGSLPFVTMDSLARFLVAMGYPEERLRDPRDGGFTTSGYVDSVKLAGIVAWHIERDGMPPILVGHSRGGMVVMRTLHELAGAFQDAIPVWDPVRDEPLARTSIVDPSTGAARPVVGLALRYAVAIATGKLPRLLTGQWSMLRRVREVPDTVQDFTGLAIEGDMIADGILGREPYVPLGRARVRNVLLPGSTGHVDAVSLAPLAADPAARAFVDDYRPDRGAAVPAALAEVPNVLEGAELWYGIRRAWCEESRIRTVRAQR